MNLQPYRKSFTVFVAGSELDRVHPVVQLLSDVGYACEYKLKLESLYEDIFKTPPHIIVMFYNDASFFADNYECEKVLEKLIGHLPEVQIIFLSSADKMSTACGLYEFGIYDCLSWPSESPIQLLKAVDRAAVNDYYMYLNEQLKERLLGQDITPMTDFAMFDLFVKELEAAQSKEEMIELCMREAMRVHGLKESLYLSYIETKKSLLVTSAHGFAPDDVRDVGLDLQKEEPGFESQMLKTPEKLRSLHQFVMRGLSRREALFYSLVIHDKILGVFILPAKEGEMFTVQQEESPYVKMCLHLMSRQIEYNKLKEKYTTTNIYDEKTGVLTQAYFKRKLNEEVSRARRILKPVALVQLSVDGYDDLTLRFSASVTDQLLSSVAEILIKNSRLNDMVARLDKDSFVICLPHTDKRGAIVKAERLRRIFSNADFGNLLGAKANITVSVGVSEYPSICHDGVGLLQSSEKSMFEVKRVGGNRIQLAAAAPQFVPDFVVQDAKNI